MISVRFCEFRPIHLYSPLRLISQLVGTGREEAGGVYFPLISRSGVSSCLVCVFFQAIVVVVMGSVRRSADGVDGRWSRTDLN